MRKNPLEGNVFFLAFTSFLTIVAIYFGINQNIIAASITLISSLITIILLTLRRLRRLVNIELNADVTNNFTLLLLYESGKDYDSHIKQLKEKYTNTQIKIVTYEIRETEKLRSALEPASGIILFLSEAIKYKADQIFPTIDTWTESHQARPIIVVYSKDEQMVGDGMEDRICNFKKIPLAQIEDSIYLLLAKAVSRSRLFMQSLNVWRASFFAVSILVLTLGLFVLYHFQFDERHIYIEQSLIEAREHIPTQNIRELSVLLSKSKNDSFANEYKDASEKFVQNFVDYYVSEMRSIAHDETIDISYWRSFGSMDSLHRVSKVIKMGHNWLPLSDSSIAGCSCLFNNFVGYKFIRDTIYKCSFWDDGTGVVSLDLTKKCYYFPNGNGIQKCIISHSTKNNDCYSVISIASDKSSDMYDNKKLNDIVKKKLYELNYILSLLPDSFFLNRHG